MIQSIVIPSAIHVQYFASFHWFKLLPSFALIGQFDCHGKKKQKSPTDLSGLVREKLTWDTVVLQIVPGNKQRKGDHSLNSCKWRYDNANLWKLIMRILKLRSGKSKKQKRVEKSWDEGKILSPLEESSSKPLDSAPQYPATEQQRTPQ